jgi:hypothetical protein
MDMEPFNMRPFPQVSYYSTLRYIKKVKIEMEFRSMDSQDNDSAVRVIEVAPGDPTAWFLSRMRNHLAGSLKPAGFKLRVLIPHLFLRLFQLPDHH